MDGIVAMLTDDARYSMPPEPVWYQGPDAIRAFLLDGPLRERWRFLPAWANGQLAFGTYLWDVDRDAYVACALDLVALRGARVAEVVSFLLSPTCSRRSGCLRRFRRLRRDELTAGRGL